MNRIAFRICSGAALVLVLALSSPACGAAEKPAVPMEPARGEETNSLDTLRGLVQLQGQLHETELALERNRKEAELAATRAAEALENRLQAIEHSLSVQHSKGLEKELEAMQSSNRVMLIVAGSFAGIGCVAMLLMGWFQWRTVNRLAEISANLPAARGLGAGAALPMLTMGDTHLLTGGAAQESNGRLLGALEQLERRLRELEQTTKPQLKAGGNGAASNGEHRSSDEAPAEASPAAVLLGKGQALLDADNAEGALACFEEALALAPEDTEALVKKGAALERLRKLDEAIACYDKAIAANKMLTIAWLYKGGVFNRMERFSEAVECYEQALRTQEKQR